MQDFLAYTYKNNKQYAVIKGITADKKVIELLQPFILDFCINKRVISLLDAYNALTEYPNAIKKIGNKFKHFKQILSLLSNKVRFRTEYIENGKTVRDFHWVQYDNVREWVADNLGFENQVSIHEIIVNDMNHLTFDIDNKDGSIDIDSVTRSIYTFIDEHPIIKVLYNT